MTASIRQILVHFDAGRNSASRLEVGRRLAQLEGATVNALYSASSSFLKVPFAPDISTTVAADPVAVDNKRRDQARQAFNRAVSSPGPEVAWADTCEAPIIAAFSQQALFSDLLVLGQPVPGDVEHTAVPVDFVESVIASSGKPALVVPYVFAGELQVGTVVIAWKGTREAARAVQGAMPFLLRAKHVHVLQWGHIDRPLEGARLDLMSYLKLHGIECRWHNEGPEPDHLGELLLSRAADLAADLIVLGCYGHSRAREWVLGGVSRTVLGSMTIPLLMAH